MLVLALILGISMSAQARVLPGFGLRLGNSRSAFGNVPHIDVAFPLDGGPGVHSVQYLIESKKSF